MILEELYTENWILAYEARKWLPSINSNNYLLEDDSFKLLDEKNIYFFNPNAGKIG